MFATVIKSRGPQKYQRRFRWKDNAISDSCNDLLEETIEHYLLHCKKIHVQRNLMIFRRMKLIVAEINFKSVLSAKEKNKDVSKSMFAILIKFIVNTNKLSNI